MIHKCKNIEIGIIKSELRYFIYKIREPNTMIIMRF